MSFFQSNRKKVVRGRMPAQTDVSFRRHLFIGFFSLSVILLICFGIHSATRLPAVTITDIRVDGGETISHDEVRRIAQDSLVGTYLLLIPKRFSFLYPHDGMLTALLRIPRIYDVIITQPSLTELSVSFKEHQPHALWCSESLDDARCHFLNAEGYAFAEAPHLQGGSLVRHHTEGLHEVQSGQVIDAHTLQKVDAFIAKVEAGLGLRITELVYDKNKDAKFMINGGGMIFVSMQKDLEVTYENLKSVLISKEFKHLTPGNFQYIDVRFDNKVFVNEAPIVIASTTPVASTSTLPE